MGTVCCDCFAVGVPVCISYKMYGVFQRTRLRDVCNQLMREMIRVRIFLATQTFF